jgi:hypothetical protein
MKYNILKTSFLLVSVAVKFAASAPTGTQYSPIVYGWFNGPNPPVLPASGGDNINNTPEEIGIVSIFDELQVYGDNETLVEYYRSAVQMMQNRGQKVVFGSGLDRYWRINNNTWPTDEAGYESYARQINDTVSIFGLDGFDVDVESTTIPVQKDLIGILTALSKYFGPSSTTGKLFVYDTNFDGTYQPFVETRAFYDLVVQQAYFSSAGEAEFIWDSYSSLIPSTQFILAANFQDDSGTQFCYDSSSNCPQIYSFASLAVSKNLGGAGAYTYNQDYSTGFKYIKGTYDILHGANATSLCDADPCTP